MYQGLPEKPVPYVLSCDRDAAVQTWWWIRPETAIETKTQQIRFSEGQNAIAPGLGNAQKKAQVDFDLMTEKLLNNVVKVENYREENDCFDTPEAIKPLLERLDFVSRGELGLAAHVASILTPGIAKNWNSSSST